MTAPEWNEIVEWIDQRFTKGWRAEQAVAYFEDLAEFDATDVWSAVYALYEKGIDFAPTGSKLRSRALEERRQSAVDARYDTVALPEPVEEMDTKDGWIARRYPGEVVSGAEHIRRWHRAKGPCGSRFCDIHTDEPVSL